MQAIILFDKVQRRLGMALAHKPECFLRWKCFVRRAVSASYIASLPDDRDELIRAADALADKHQNYMDTCVMDASAVCSELFQREITRT